MSYVVKLTFPLLAVLGIFLFWYELVHYAMYNNA